jgi:hypothetical protein
MRALACYEKARSLGYFEFERRGQYHFIEGYSPD